MRPHSNERESITSPLDYKHIQYSPPLNLGVLASGKGTNFEALINSIESNKLNARISLLIVNKESCEAINKAKKNNIPYKFLDHRMYNNREEYDKAIAKEFKKSNIEGIVMAGWMRVVTKNLLNIFPNRIINIHPSLLPAFKGLDAVTQALIAGVKITGCTVHIVHEKLDSGPILIQSAVPVLENDNRVSLLKRIQIQEHKILSIGLTLAGAQWRKNQ